MCSTNGHDPDRADDAVNKRTESPSELFAHGPTYEWRGNGHSKDPRKKRRRRGPGTL